MTSPDLNVFSEQVFRDAAFGLGLLAIILVLNTILFIRIFLWFLKGSAKLVKPRALDLIILFVSSVLLMSLVQIGSIMIWTVALYATGLIADIRLAMLFRVAAIRLWVYFQMCSHRAGNPSLFISRSQVYFLLRLRLHP